MADKKSDETPTTTDASKPKTPSDPTTGSAGTGSPAGTGDGVKSTSGPYNTVDSSANASVSSSPVDAIEPTDVGGANLADTDSPMSSVQFEAFPESRVEVLTSGSGSTKLKTTKQEVQASDQSEKVVEVDVLDGTPDVGAFIATKDVSGTLAIRHAGWIGPEALAVSQDELKEFKKFVAGL